ncbi:type VII secretion integral membrane protein EccD [Actinomadura sp. HBU206391]|uniref:type VII secretion integral membrane protein EccD n=1 Tax=Actinomadura sp. HBU206391 TaxID=2731692 RepID=UPI0016500261|nr:type VII secretion integral membrane protein EccD [Actinomadura sp. HBU206391]MBC6457976.1 type VII secretion integral membrane protein EccD [Actinomadura sp. HBU206391]
MSPTTGAELCRVTIVGPKRRVDISLPAHVPFAQLWPAILHYSGDNLADAGLAHGGWVLQRLDEAPFDGAVTPAQATLRDGEMLYLRPTMAQLPEMSFDDVADVVATSVNDRPDRWRVEWTRNFGMGVAALAAATAAAVVLLSGPSWILPSIAAGVLGLLTLIAAVAISRAVGDGRAGVVLGFCALPHAFLAGLLAPARDTALTDLSAVHALSGFAVVVLVAMVAAVGVTDGLPVFLGAAFAALMGAIGAGMAVLFDGVSAAGVAAVTVTVTSGLMPLTPTIAFRLARVTLPPVPESAEDLRRDTLMVDGQQVLRRTAQADRFVTGIVLGLGLVGFAAQIPLAFSDGWLGPTMSAVVAVALLLRSRIFRGRAQRLALMVPGVAGLGVLAVASSVGADQSVILMAVLAPLLAVTAVVVGVSLWLPDHRPSPFWGRAADIIDLLVVLSLVPLALGEVGLFSYVRGLAG